ncbi:MAG: GGDEF domain-containing protein [Alphaproteobacteria bacterium]|nr:GGDEF domain-containing protein [Alphaproteobacteria bacterium]
MQANAAPEASETPRAAKSSALVKDYEAQMKLAISALDLVRNHLTPPNPKTFEFWYEYADGNNADLKAEVDAILKRGPGSLSTYDVEQFYDQYIRSKNDEDDAEREASSGLDDELKAVHEVLRNYVEHSKSFGDTLSVSMDELTPDATAQQIAKTVQCLIGENQRMEAETSELRSSVENSQEQVKLLETRLQKAKDVSLYDPLTQLRNRGYYDQELPKLVIKAALDEKPLCLAVADIDHFKRVNDNFGHQIGDGVLKLFADLLMKNIKGRDLVVRFGGEEFVVLLPETQLSDAMVLLEQIRKKLQGLSLSVRTTGQTVGNVTASFGLVQLRPDEDKSALFERADQLLYRAKEEGRNRIITEND